MTDHDTKYISSGFPFRKSALGISYLTYHLNAWKRTYYYLPHINYEISKNENEEKKRYSKYCDPNTFLIMMELGIRGKETQGKIGRKIFPNYAGGNSNALPGVRFKNWVIDYLEPMGFVQMDMVIDGAEKSNVYSLTEMGVKVLVLYSVIIYVDILEMYDDDWRGFDKELEIEKCLKSKLSEIKNIKSFTQLLLINDLKLNVDMPPIVDIYKRMDRETRMVWKRKYVHDVEKQDDPNIRIK